MEIVCLTLSNAIDYFLKWLNHLTISCEKLWNYTNKNLPSNPLGVVCHNMHGVSPYLPLF